MKSPRSFASTIAVLLAAGLVVLAVLSGTVEDTDRTLVVMGFDPDRAQLITSLILGGCAAALAALAVPAIPFATLLGALAVAALYTQTFLAETGNALSASGALGSFSAGGWLLTLVTLVTIGVLAAAAGAALAVVLRPALVATGRDVVALTRETPRRRHVGRPVVALLVLALLTVTTPAFGDMVNLSPDALMLGGVERVALTGDSSTTSAAPGTATASPPGVASSGDGAIAPTATGTLTPINTPGATAPLSTKPWLAWKPSGSGSIKEVNLTAPWTGGTRPVITVSIFMPPGYDPNGTRRYPVLYEAPTGLGLWNQGTSSVAATDALIDAGTIPASIVVYVDEWGAPYPDTECADSTDGRMKMETFISSTVVQYVDSHYLTIAKPGARGLMGMSTGGFCAPMITLRHPDVFGSSISFSGYFVAGSASANSARPFGTPAALASHSPLDLLPTIPPAVRSSLYFEVIADPNQPFYGPQAAQFDRALKADGFALTAVNSTFPHGWPEVRYAFPMAIEQWSARLVANHVF